MAIADMNDAAFASGARRRYDLDWLRAIAFGLLIFYHIGMFYVTWGWHVKSAYAGPAGEFLMLLVNPWRLALLFFISGVAVRFASDKAVSLPRYVGDRTMRLGLPILFGMIVTVAPQSYLQLRQAGVIEPGFFAFWPDYLSLKQSFEIITPTWNHLWYLVYLLAYILLIAPFLPQLRRFAEGTGGRWFGAALGGPVRLMLITVIPFVLYELVLSPRFPTTHAFWGDWANHAHRFTVFMLGYFAAKNDRFWQSVAKAWVWALGAAIVIGAARMYLRQFHWDFYASLFDGAFAPVMASVLTLYAWSCIVALFGAAQRWLNRPSQLLTYLTGAVFCYYVLHQTITIIAGYYLTQLRLGAWPEFALVTLITLAGCAGGYEVLRRIPGLRLCFGIKMRPPAMIAAAAPAAACGEVDIYRKPEKPGRLNLAGGRHGHRSRWGGHRRARCRQPFGARGSSRCRL